MFAMKTEIINTTGSTITVKEANAGVIRRTVGIMKNHGSLTVDVQNNPTFTEFKCVQDVEPPVPDILITSDEIADNKEIRIYQKPDKTFSWKGVPRAPIHEHPAGTPRSILGSIRSWFSRNFMSRRANSSDQLKKEQEGK